MMKAVTIPRYGEPDVLTLCEVPDPVMGPEDLLVGVRATSLNRADLLQRRGLYPQPGPKPDHEIPGLEFAGEVLEVGPRVSGFAAGDRVMGLLPGGGYAERITTHHRLAVKIPDQLDWTQAAACPEAFITAHDALAQCRLACGEAVLVHAVGSGVGIAAIQVAAVMGATPILGTARSREKLERAATLGLDVAIAGADFAPAAAEATGGRGVDVIVDFVGASYLDANLKALAVKGRLMLIGLMGGFAAEANLGMVLSKRLEIRGTLLRARSLEEKAAATRAFEKSVVPHLANGRIVPVVDRVLALSAAAEAHGLMETNANFGKIVLEV